MRRTRGSTMASNPILIGAVTVLVTIIAVTLAYNATVGLPFVPTYDLHVQIADASELQKGDQASIGGALVGTVASVDPARTKSGRPIAVLNLKLYESVNPLPVDTRFTIRLKGSIGLKYLQISPGRSRKGWHNGATVPLTQSGSTVDFDQVLSMFTPATALGIQRSTIGFGTALAGRGSDINSAIGAFLPLLRDLGPVARNLASPKTNLGGFFRALESYNAALVPVAQTQATLFGNLDTTFRALAGIATPYLQETISDTPPSFEATINGSPVIRPFLQATTQLFADLRPGAATLPQSAPVLAQAFAIGTKTLPGTAELDQRTLALARKLESYGATPAVQQGLDRLTLTLSRLQPPLSFLTPAQSTCNYVTLFLRNTSSLLGDHVAQGGLLRFVQVAIARAPNAESGPSSKPYTGPSGIELGPLHSNPYPYTDSPGQPARCAAGNEVYSTKGSVIGNPAGKVTLSTEPTKASAQ